MTRPGARTIRIRHNGYGDVNIDNVNEYLPTSYV